MKNLSATVIRSSALNAGLSLMRDALVAAGAIETEDNKTFDIPVSVVIDEEGNERVEYVKVSFSVRDQKGNKNRAGYTPTDARAKFEAEKAESVANAEALKAKRAALKATNLENKARLARKAAEGVEVAE